MPAPRQKEPLWPVLPTGAVPAAPALAVDLIEEVLDLLWRLGRRIGIRSPGAGGHGGRMADHRD